MWTDKRKGRGENHVNAEKDIGDESVIDNDNDKIGRQQDKETARFGAHIFALSLPRFPLAPSPLLLLPPPPILGVSPSAKEPDAKQLINSDLLCFPFTAKHLQRQKKGKGRNRGGEGLLLTATGGSIVWRWSAWGDCE